MHTRFTDQTILATDQSRVSRNCVNAFVQLAGCIIKPWHCSQGLVPIKARLQTVAGEYPMFIILKTLSLQSFRDWSQLELQHLWLDRVRETLCINRTFVIIIKVPPSEVVFAVVKTNLLLLRLVKQLLCVEPAFGTFSCRTQIVLNNSVLICCNQVLSLGTVCKFVGEGRELEISFVSTST